MSKHFFFTGSWVCHRRGFTRSDISDGVWENFSLCCGLSWFQRSPISLDHGNGSSPVWNQHDHLLVSTSGSFLHSSPLLSRQALLSLAVLGPCTHRTSESFFYGLGLNLTTSLLLIQKSYFCSSSILTTRHGRKEDRQEISLSHWYQHGGLTLGRWQQIF